MSRISLVALGSILDQDVRMTNSCVMDSNQMWAINDSSLESRQI